MIRGHGGNIYHLARQCGCSPAEISDMSANVNPLGPMPALMDHLNDRLADMAVLPEVDAAGITAAFSRFHSVPADQVMAGNGTTELIYLIPRALQSTRALVVGPTYADYVDACTMNRVPCEHVICRQADNYAPNMTEIRRMAALADLIFLCNPNNPTGAMAHREDLDALCRDFPDTCFVIDESYLPFAPHPERVTMIQSNRPNVIVLNSMSKAFSIPGLRIGFAKAAPPLMDKLKAFSLPWTVNSLAQTAVTWIMTHPESVQPFLAETRKMVGKEKRRMQAHIRKKSDIHCFPSATSFILMRLPKGLAAGTACRHMADNRILIRDCSNFIGLSDAHIRIALKTEAENRRAADVLVRLCRDRTGQGASHA